MRSSKDQDRPRKDRRPREAMSLDQACRLAVPDLQLLEKIKIQRSTAGIRITGQPSAVGLFFWRHLDLFKIATPMSDTCSGEVHMELMPMPSAHAKVLTGPLIVRLMRVYGKSIRGLAGEMKVSMVQVREARRSGVSNAVAIRDWVEAIAAPVRPGNQRVPEQPDAESVAYLTVTTSDGTEGRPV